MHYLSLGFIGELFPDNQSSYQLMVVGILIALVIAVFLSVQRLTRHGIALSDYNDSLDLTEPSTMTKPKLPSWPFLVLVLVVVIGPLLFLPPTDKGINAKMEGKQTPAQDSFIQAHEQERLDQKPISRADSIASIKEDFDAADKERQERLDQKLKAGFEAAGLPQSIVPDIVQDADVNSDAR